MKDWFENMNRDDSGFINLLISEMSFTETSTVVWHNHFHWFFSSSPEISLVWDKVL